MRRIVFLLAFSLFLAPGGLSQEVPEEVVPGQAWEDPDGSPPPWFEDPATIDCGARLACWAVVDNLTAVDA